MMTMAQENHEMTKRSDSTSQDHMPTCRLYRVKLVCKIYNDEKYDTSGNTNLKKTQNEQFCQRLNFEHVAYMIDCLFGEIL